MNDGALTLEQQTPPMPEAAPARRQPFGLGGDRMKSSQRFSAVVLLAVYLVVLLRTAWVCDDAYITFRVLDNFLAGYGLRWNTVERVWAFTNPLWLFFMAPAYALTHEVFYTVLAASFAFSGLTFWLVARRAGARGMRLVLVGLLLTCSKAFVDFSTSGLESPLSHLLLAAFAILLLEADATRPRPALLALLAGCATLNRPDAALFYLPALGWVLWRQRGWKTLQACLLGFLPLILWELFALVYYGFPFPNTAYAKLANSFGQGIRLWQGLTYFLQSLDLDPLTLPVIGLGLGLALASRRAPLRMLGLGVALNLAYILWIGGDFMSGRFFTGDFLLAVLILCYAAPRLKPSHEMVVCALVLAAGLSNPSSPLASGSGLGQGTYNGADFRNINDERKFYYENGGLLRTNQAADLPRGEPAADGRAMRAISDHIKERAHVQVGMIGIYGYMAGPKVHIIDPLALPDAFLVRMPAVVAHEFFPGHIIRRIPANYEQTLKTGVNQIQPKAAARLFDAVRSVTRDPLWSPRRLREIVRLNTGFYQPLMQEISDYYGDGRTRIFYKDLATTVGAGQPWNGPRALRMGAEGITVLFDALQHGSGVQATIPSTARFRFSFLRDGEVVHTQVASAPYESHLPLLLVKFPLPAAVRTAGFDRIKVEPLNVDGRFSIGHLLVDP